MTVNNTLSDCLIVFNSYELEIVTIYSYLCVNNNCRCKKKGKAYLLTVRYCSFMFMRTWTRPCAIPPLLCLVPIYQMFSLRGLACWVSLIFLHMHFLRPVKSSPVRIPSYLDWTSCSYLHNTQYRGFFQSLYDLQSFKYLVGTTSCTPDSTQSSHIFSTKSSLVSFSDLSNYCISGNCMR